MRVFSLIFTLLGLQFVTGQDVVQNLGNLKIFEGGQVLFGSDLFNEGNFRDNQGLLVLRSGESQVISGSNHIDLAQLTVDNRNDVWIENEINVRKQLIFSNGNLITLKSNPNHSVRFTSNAQALEANNIKKVDGYAIAQNKSSFLLPVGDATALRPLYFEAESPTMEVKCAYFNENPNSSLFFNTTMDTQSRENEIEAISKIEFWALHSDKRMNVTLSWVGASRIHEITNDHNNLVIVGWHRSTNQWVSLGVIESQGNLDEGYLTSAVFDAIDISAVTFGSQQKNISDLDFVNGFISPNGDGTNDNLVIDGIENFPNNRLEIYNRYGIMVYKKLGYRNDFVGLTNRHASISRQKGLSPGVYYYILHIEGSLEKRQGFFYLSSK